MTKPHVCPMCGHKRYPPQDIFLPYDGVPSFFDFWFIITNVGMFVCRDVTKRTSTDVILSFMESVAPSLKKLPLRISVLGQSEFMAMSNEQRAKVLSWTHNLYASKGKPKLVKGQQEKVKRKREDVLKEAHEHRRSVHQGVASQLAAMQAFYDTSHKHKSQGNEA